MTKDVFEHLSDNPEAPSRNAFALTPSDTEPLNQIPKAIYVGTGGTLVLRTEDASADATFKNLASGQILPVRAEFVRATGTTAADIVALA